MNKKEALVKYKEIKNLEYVEKDIYDKFNAVDKLDGYVPDNGTYNIGHMVNVFNGVASIRFVLQSELTRIENKIKTIKKELRDNNYPTAGELLTAEKLVELMK